MKKFAIVWTILQANDFICPLLKEYDSASLQQEEYSEKLVSRRLQSSVDELMSSSLISDLTATIQSADPEQYSL